MNLKERFTKAIQMIIGKLPPESFVDEWINDIPVGGVHRLQEWVLNQGAPSWCQGIILLEAAMYIAENPVEGLWDIN